MTKENNNTGLIITIIILAIAGLLLFNGKLQLGSLISLDTENCLSTEPATFNQMLPYIESWIGQECSVSNDKEEGKCAISTHTEALYKSTQCDYGYVKDIMNNICVPSTLSDEELCSNLECNYIGGNNSNIYIGCTKTNLVNCSLVGDNCECYWGLAHSTMPVYNVRNGVCSCVSACSCFMGTAQQEVDYYINSTELLYVTDYTNLDQAFFMYTTTKESCQEGVARFGGFISGSYTPIVKNGRDIYKYNYTTEGRTVMGYGWCSNSDNLAFFATEDYFNDYWSTFVTCKQECWKRNEPINKLSPVCSSYLNFSCESNYLAESSCETPEQAVTCWEENSGECTSYQSAISDGCTTNYLTKETCDASIKSTDKIFGWLKEHPIACSDNYCFESIYNYLIWLALAGLALYLLLKGK